MPTQTWQLPTSSVMAGLKKKKEEQESPLGVGWSGCKILLCLAFKGYLPELLIHLINQGTAQAKELP